jgi:hypothetical protein
MRGLHRLILALAHMTCGIRIVGVDELTDFFIFSVLALSGWGEAENSPNSNPVNVLRYGSRIFRA